MMGLESVSKGFQGRKVLHNVSATVSEGDFVTLEGENGSGKTTLLRLIAGLIRPDCGRVVFPGNSRRRFSLGMVSHEGHLYPGLTALENLEFSCRYQGVTMDEDRVYEEMKALGVYRFRHEPLTRLSRGMLQKVAVMRCLALQPPLMLLDEPFSGLDSRTRPILRSMLRERADEGQAVIVVSHRSEELKKVSDVRWILAKGRVSCE